MAKNRKLSDEAIEKVIANAKDSLAIEGLIVTNEEENLVREYLKGMITEKEALETIKNSVI